MASTENLLKLEENLLAEATLRTITHDPSHDMEHIRRVLAGAKLLQKTEGGDLEVIIPAAIFHDLIIYAKDDPKNKFATDESAVAAVQILKNHNYPEEKIEAVATCIRECSWSKGLPGSSLESRILQDADRLEAVGAIAIMRTFSSGGIMGRPFYTPGDPFNQNQSPSELGAGLDLFEKRLLRVAELMNTRTGKVLAYRRKYFLEDFIKELKRELSEIDLYSFESK